MLGRDAPAAAVGQATSLAQVALFEPLKVGGTRPPPLPSALQVAASSSCVIQSKVVPIWHERGTGIPPHLLTCVLDIPVDLKVGML